MPSVIYGAYSKHMLTHHQLGDQRSAVARSAAEADVVLDARDLHCPRSHRHAEPRHNGMHPLVMESLADLPAAAKWLAAAVLQVHAWGRYRHHVQGAATPLEVLV